LIFENSHGFSKFYFIISAFSYQYIEIYFCILILLSFNDFKFILYWYTLSFFSGGRGLNPGPCIYYAFSYLRSKAHKDINILYLFEWINIVYFVKKKEFSFVGIGKKNLQRREVQILNSVLHIPNFLKKYSVWI
jgi:hypothetical protein